jgi:hypothetical protein
MSSLFKIENDILALRNLLESEQEFSEQIDSEDKKVIEDQLAIKQEELATKVEGYIHVINQSEAQIVMANAEIERIHTFIDRKEHVVERLKGALLQALLLFGDEDKNGVKKMEIGTLRLSTRKSTSVEITGEVPNQFKLFDASFKNLSSEMATFLRKRIEDLPASVGKTALQEAFKVDEKVSKTLIGDNLKKGADLSFAQLNTKYGLTIK